MKRSDIAKIITSCENPEMIYMEFPDGLRVRFDGDDYAGWYLAGEVER